MSISLILKKKKKKEKMRTLKMCKLLSMFSYETVPKADNAMNIGLILISFLLDAQERDDPLHLLSVNQTGFHNQIKYHGF